MKKRKFFGKRLYAAVAAAGSVGPQVWASGLNPTTTLGQAIGGAIDEIIVILALIAVGLTLGSGYKLQRSELRDGWLGLIGGIALFFACAGAGAQVGIPAIGLEGAVLVDSVSVSGISMSGAPLRGFDPTFDEPSLPGIAEAVGNAEARGEFSKALWETRRLGERFPKGCGRAVGNTRFGECFPSEAAGLPHPRHGRQSEGDHSGGSEI